MNHYLPSVLILGAGVSGLSCAILLKKGGYNVKIWSSELPPHTTSNKAAAVWYPFIVNPPALATRWARETLDFFLREILPEPTSGVYPTVVTELFVHEKEDPWWIEAAPTFRRISRNRLVSGYRDGYEIDAVVMVTDIYLTYLLAKIRHLGIPITMRRVSALEEAIEQADVVINCTGLGSRKLCNDQDLRPVRGQIVKVPPNGLTHSVFEEEGPNSLAYIIPRRNDIIIGGTAQTEDWDLNPRMSDTRDIIKRCGGLYPQLKKSRILDILVGLRPHRSSVRLEPEVREGKVLVHNYGHGGSGFTISWGCAFEVLKIVKDLTA